MQKIYFLFLWLAAAFPALATGIFRATDQDPYAVASFSREAELENLLASPSHATFIEAFEKEFGADFDTPKQYEALKSINVDDWEIRLFEQRNKQMSFFKNHTQFAEFSPEFRDLILTNINFNYWHLLLAYSINRSEENTNQKNVSSLPRIMIENLDQSKINEEKWLISKSYREFLPYFIIYFNSADHGFQKYSDGSKGLNDKAQLAEKRLSGHVFDYTLTQLISRYHPHLSTGAFRFWASQIYCQKLQEYLSGNYFEIITKADKEREAKGQKLEELKSKNLPILMDLGDQPFTFEKYKGKVIYVDFWASWCGPCRSQFPYSKKLHESLSDKQKEEVVFLYISIDQDIQKWKEAVEKLGLNDSGINGHSFEVSAKYMISSIPRYMIIDKKGDVIHPNAPRPGSEETLGLLIDLLH